MAGRRRQGRRFSALAVPPPAGQAQAEVQEGSRRHGILLHRALTGIVICLPLALVCSKPPEHLDAGGPAPPGGTAAGRSASGQRHGTDAHLSRRVSPGHALRSPSRVLAAATQQHLLHMLRRSVTQRGFSRAPCSLQRTAE